MSDSTARLPRTLGLGSSIALVIGITIGSGIFRTPAAVAQRAPDGVALIGVWVAGGLISLCGALTLAELAAAFPNTGGYYVFLREGWGRPVAFLFGWAQLVLIRASALGGVAIVASDYALRMFGIDPQTTPFSRPLAALALIFAATVNILGVRLGAAVVNLSTAAKFVALAALGGSALLFGGTHGGTFDHLTEGASPITISGLGLGLVSVLWAYDGFGDLSYAGGEVKEPQRTLPRAIILGTLAIVAIYVLMNLSYIFMNDIDTIAASPLVAAETMTRVFGPRAASLVSMVVAVSAFGSLNGIMLSAPRVFVAMAEDRLLFPVLARVHPRWHTPYVAIGAAAALGIALVLNRSFESITSTFVIAIWPFYALCAAAVLRLRIKRPELARPYKVVGYPIVPAIFIAASAGFLINALVAEPLPTLLTFALILAGLPIYFFALNR